MSQAPANSMSSRAQIEQTEYWSHLITARSIENFIHALIFTFNTNFLVDKYVNKLNTTDFGNEISISSFGARHLESIFE